MVLFLSEEIVLLTLIQSLSPQLLNKNGDAVECTNGELQDKVKTALLRFQGNNGLKVTHLAFKSIQNPHKILYKVSYIHSTQGPGGTFGPL